MKKIFGILLAILLVVLISITKCSAEGSTAPHLYRARWMTNLPDSRKLNTLALMGTHNSATYNMFIAAAGTQDLNIYQQLYGGVRVLEMRVRRIENKFAMHHERMYLGMMFGDIVNDVVRFLRNNPKELVIMFMQEEYEADRSDKNECEILESYIQDNGNLFVKNWSVDDTIGQHRGKILLAVANRGFSGCITNLPCRKQNNWEINNDYKTENKWNDIKALQDEIPNAYSQCYINFLSAHGGALVSPRLIAEGLHETRGYYIAVVQVNQPGINEKMEPYFRNTKNTLYIIMADYPSLNFIHKVVDSN